MTFNIYVISYKRADQIKTAKCVEYCTYVVRKSEEEAYKAAGIENIWAIEDNKIAGFGAVMNYLIENAPEDVIAVLDDDIEKFRYRIDEYEDIKDQKIATMEIERLGQLIYDLGIGYGSVTAHVNIMYYDRPFKFLGINDAVKVFNRKRVRGRFNNDLIFMTDDDFEMQELLYNRIILQSQYFIDVADIDTNSGSISSKKSQALYDAEDEAMKLKWGKYYEKANGKGLGGIRVKR